MEITATEAKNRLGYYLRQVEREPVHVVKNGHVAAVILSADRYRELLAAADGKCFAQRRKEFDERYGEWTAAQHAMVERIGVFGEDSRPW